MAKRQMILDPISIGKRGTEKHKNRNKLNKK